MSKGKKDAKKGKKGAKEPEEELPPPPDIPEWTFYYWELRNRGNFIRLQFIYTKTEYTEITSNFRNNFAAFTPIDKLNKEISEFNGYHSPPFTVPCVRYFNKDGEPTETVDANAAAADTATTTNQLYEILFISQAVPCAEFIANKLGLLPKSGHIYDMFRAKKLLCDCNDLLDEFRSQLTKDKATAKHYLQTRLLKRLSVLEFPLARQSKIHNNNNINKNSADTAVVDSEKQPETDGNATEQPAAQNPETVDKNPASADNNAENIETEAKINETDVVEVDETVYYYFGDSVCYIDLAVFNIIDGINELLPKIIFDSIFQNYPSIIKLYNQIANNTEIEQFILEQKKNGFNWWPKGVREKVKQNLIL